jgi:hypothetical protein
MTKATRTPGEWEAFRSSVFAGKNCIGICDTANASEGRYEANARLMAAAPDLYNALRQIVSVVMEGDETGAQQIAKNAGRAALAKVEPQS